MPEEQNRIETKERIVGQICPIMSRKDAFVQCETKCAAYCETFINSKGYCSKEEATAMFQVCRLWPIEPQ